jgi:hypothetical protein
MPDRPNGLNWPLPSNMRNRLKACPWCESNVHVMIRAKDSILTEPPSEFYIGCSTCDFWSSSERSTEKLIQRWNKRAGEES